MELWDTDFVDMLEPACIASEAEAGGEFVFGAVRGDLDCRYGPDGVRFTCEGFDEMDPAFGAGSAKLAPDETLIPSALAAELGRDPASQAGVIRLSRGSIRGGGSGGGGDAARPVGGGVAA